MKGAADHSFVLTCQGTGSTGSDAVAVNIGTTERNVTVVVTTGTAPAESPAPAPAKRRGGGSLDLLTLALLGLLAAWRSRERLRHVLALTLAVLIVSPSVEAADVTTLILQSQSSTAQSDVPFTFGQAFKVGEVPAQTGLRARLGDGSSVPLQVDAKAKHADGSLRHAVLTGRLNTLAGNGGQLLTLSTGPLTGGTPIALSELLASTYDTSVTLNLGGIVYTASAREALGRATVKTWLSGPMVSEWIAVMPVRTAAGANHPHLTAYFHVRAFTGLKQVRTDVVIENNWAFVPSPGNFNYTATVNVPGKSSYVKSLTHYGRTRWHKRFWWGTEPQVYAKLDKVYLQDTRAIPKYESLQPTEAFLNSVRRSTEPMNNGDHEPNMDSSGYQPGIGLLPRWDAVYAVSTDVRAFDYMLANADGGTAYSIHIRDEKTGLPISIDNYPITSLADDSAQPALPKGERSIFSEGTWSTHQPSIGFLPYVVTGDYFYLEEAQFWSAYNLIWPNTGGSGGRNGKSGWWFNGSIRGQAWAYRSLAQAAYITPDAHPYKAYLVEKLQNNIARDTELYVSPGGPHKNNLGAMFSVDGNDTYLFFDYFMSSVVQYLVDLGFNEAIPFRDYKLKFPIGIMGKGANEYCFQAAAQFKWKAGPAGTSTFFPDFRTMFINTIPGANPADCGTAAMTTFLSRIEGGLSGPNAMLGLQGTATHYFANLLPALAAAFDSGVPGGRTAWERAQASGIRPNFQDTPIFAVVPRALATSSVNVSIAANPPKVAVGGSSTLSWSASNAESCLASGGWAGSKPTSGSEAVSGLQSTQSYVLTCTSNAAGTNAGTAVVTVGGVSRPTVTLSASTSVQSGQPLTLTWSSSDANSCVASGGWSGNKSLSGSENVGPLSNSTSFSLGCTGAGGTQIATMNVSVVVAATPSPGAEPAKKKGGGGAMTLSTLLMLLGAIAVRRIAARARGQ